MQSPYMGELRNKCQMFQQIGKKLKAVDIRKQISPDTLLIGNGDVKNYKNGIELSKDMD
jgi:hypothetical protein